MTTIERYVADLAVRLKVNRRRKVILLDEVRDHLMEAAEHRSQTLGETRDRAEDEAVRAFGGPALIARTFNAAAGARAMRRATVAAFLAGGSTVTAFLIAAVTQPRATQRATPAMQASFFLGVLAFQVAVVAGACAASRAAARWRTSAASGHDRAFVRRCSIVSMLALCSGVVAVTTNLVLDAHQASHLNGIALAFGGAAMIAAAAAGLTTTLRLDVNAADEDTEAIAARSPSILLLGESVIALVNDHPVASCAAATIAATAWATSQAEVASVAAALPWGIGEAFTVIGAFILLGPALGLRQSTHTVERA